MATDHATETTLLATRAMAYLLDITDRRLQQLADENVVSPVKRGVWNLVETAHGYIRYLREHGSTKNDAIDARRERARLLAAQADKVELELAILRADTIPAETVRAVWSKMLSACRARLLAVPTRVAGAAMAAASIQESETLVRELIYEALNELADFDPEHYRTERARAAHLARGDADPAAAAEPDRDGMGEPQPVPQPRRQRRARSVPPEPSAVPAGDHGRGARGRRSHRGGDE
jgi:phage terminase Nu1 subunit (DNA packaging protein)